MAGLKVSADRVLESAGVLEVQPLQTDTNLAMLQMYRLVIQCPGKAYPGSKQVTASATEAFKSMVHCGHFMRSRS